MDNLANNKDLDEMPHYAVSLLGNFGEISTQYLKIRTRDTEYIYSAKEVLDHQLFSPFLELFGRQTQNNEHLTFMHFIPDQHK